MKPFIALTCFATLILPLPAVTWDTQHEASVQQALTSIAQTLPQQTAVIGRTGVAETRSALVIDAEGHLLAPYLPAIDQKTDPYEPNDDPYVLYRPDGSRLTLTTVVEKPKRSVALLKIEDPASALPVARVSPLTGHTVIVPTSAPIASLGEPASLFVDHLETPLDEEDDSFQLDTVFFRPGTPVLDLAGALVGTTLEVNPRSNSTPVLMISRLRLEFPELDAALAEATPSDLPDLPDAPVLDKEELAEMSLAPLTKARQRFIQKTHPAPSPCVLVSNENTTQATHSAIGTIIRPNGLILTKASELGPSFRVRYDGQSYPAVLLSTDEATDLALIGIAASNLPVVRWSDQMPAPGATVASPVLLQESTEDMVSEPTSYLGAFSHLLPENQPTVHATSQVTSLGFTSEQIDSQLTIAALKAESPAYESGLSPGDVILEIDDTKLTTRAELTAFLNDCEVGQKVRVKVDRAGTEKEYEVELISPLIVPPTTGLSVEDGVPMIPSVRRAPFPAVLVHTAPLNAWDCGSPLFDLQGQAVGLNIAAAAPARTLALPPAEVREAVRRLLAQTRAF